MTEAKTELELGTHRRIHCNTCKIPTNHQLEAVHVRFCQDDDEPYLIGPGHLAMMPPWAKSEYRLWFCLGCDTATLEEAFTDHVMEDPNGNQIWGSNYYPKRAHQDLLQKRFRRLDEKLTSIYREVIESYNTNLNVLCAVGLRALLEGVCADKGVTGRNLEKKIDNLTKYLPSNIVENLHGFRFMGNEAAHELQAPQQSELRLAIEVMEDLLNFLYELDYKSRVLSRKWMDDLGQITKSP